MRSECLGPFALVLAPILFCLFAGCGADEGPGETPEETISSLQSAAGREDWGAIYDLIHASQREDDERRWKNLLKHAEHGKRNRWIVANYLADPSPTERSRVERKDHPEVSGPVPANMTLRDVFGAYMAWQKDTYPDLWKNFVEGEPSLEWSSEDSALCWIGSGYTRGHVFLERIDGLWWLTDSLLSEFAGLMYEIQSHDY